MFWCLDLGDNDDEFGELIMFALRVEKSCSTAAWLLLLLFGDNG